MVYGVIYIHIYSRIGKNIWLSLKFRPYSM